MKTAIILCLLLFSQSGLVAQKYEIPEAYKKELLLEYENRVPKEIRSNHKGYPKYNYYISKRGKTEIATIAFPVQVRCGKKYLSAGIAQIDIRIDAGNKKITQSWHVDAFSKAGFSIITKTQAEEIASKEFGSQDWDFQLVLAVGLNVLYWSSRQTDFLGEYPIQREIHINAVSAKIAFQKNFYPGPLQLAKTYPKNFAVLNFSKGFHDITSNSDIYMVNGLTYLDDANEFKLKTQLKCIVQSDTGWIEKAPWWVEYGNEIEVDSLMTEAEVVRYAKETLGKHNWNFRLEASKGSRTLRWVHYIQKNEKGKRERCSIDARTREIYTIQNVPNKNDLEIY